MVRLCGLLGGWGASFFNQPRNFCFVFSEIDVCYPRSAPARGRIAIVTNVARNAVAAMMPIDERHIRGRSSRVVLTRPCRRQVGDDAVGASRR